MKTETRVCCQVCRKAVASSIVKDFAFKTFAACLGCIRVMDRCHPSRPTVVR